MHIVVAIDRSTESRNALENALDIVNAFDGSITAVHAVDTDDNAGRSAGQEILEAAAERGAKRNVSIGTELLVGDPVEAIADYAENNEADAIYVGHRGLTSEGSELHGDARGPLGSVAKGLVQRTQVPVTVYDRGL